MKTGGLPSLALVNGTWRWPLRLSLLLGSLLIIFLVGEVITRILLHRALAPLAETSKGQETEASSSKATQASEIPELPEDGELPVLKGVLDLARKNVVGLHKGVSFRINSQGIRGPEYPEVADEDVFRIAITGDSVTMGEGVPEQATYSARLSEFLEPAGLDRRIEVINVGLSGVNIGVAIQRLKSAIDAYHPDMIVYGFTINDIEGALYEKPARESDELMKELKKSRFAESSSVLVRLLWWKWVNFRLAQVKGRDWYVEEVLFNYSENVPALQKWTQGMDQFKRLAQVHGICAHVFIHTHLNYLNEDHPYLPIYEMVGVAATERGLPVTSTFELFRGRDRGELWVGYFDPHPNPEGHEILSRALARGLTAMPASCWRRP